ncbi:hypothetical protein [Dyadobacter sp. MSC1_007]|jgi:hypothetical protein|uniref:hypothetical protein n=1 Tax=Dyadobacter sp. MSC1_007 TaxID=2909264 RepID=UPI00202F263C|nr:hypothetical protein [Dyadobacter sp. MSC1_007]
MEKVTVQMLLCLFLLNTPGISQERIVKISGRKYNVLTKGVENRSAKDAVVFFESGMGVDLGNWNKIIDQ